MSACGWIGVDLDGTLAYYDGSIDYIGPPIPLMLERVKSWLREGKMVRIFTARVSSFSGLRVHEAATQLEMIDKWCLKYIGKRLPVTCEKDYGMIELWDDRCHPVEYNTGVDLLKEMRS